MFYEPNKKNHGLAQDPFKACVVPRPIGWISTQDINGNCNLAPFSFFNAIAEDPPMIMFSATGPHVEGGPKDTIKNIEETGEFVVNIATFPYREAMNKTSANFLRNENEIEYAGLSILPSKLVKPPRIKESPIHLECKSFQIVPLPSKNSHFSRMIIGEVIGIHIDNTILTDGKIDMNKLQPIARLGYQEYAHISQIFKMERPRLNIP